MLLGKRIYWRLRGLGIDPFPTAVRNPRGDGRSPLEVFDEIHKDNLWGSSESVSGPGSNCAYAQQYCQELHALLKVKQLIRIFDAPCGDLNWITPIVEDPELNYSGGDVSARVVQAAIKRSPAVSVTLFDITVDKFPAADVWHCRDCLFHLPFADIRRSLENFAGSDVPFALLTTHGAWLFHRNLDVNLGGFRYLDLHHKPIGLPRALAYLRDYRPGLDFPRYVGLWSRDSIVNALKRWPI